MKKNVYIICVHVCALCVHLNVYLREKCQKLCSMGYWIQYGSWQNAFIGLKTVDTIIMLATVFIQPLSHIHFNTFNWDMISPPTHTTHSTTILGQCKQLEYFSFCYVQKFIDKCLVINFHDNIFICALSFHILFFTSIFFLFFRFPSHAEQALADHTIICIVFLCIISRAFVYTSPLLLSLLPSDHR